MRLLISGVLLTISFLASGVSVLQTAERVDASASVDLPLAPTRTIRFTTEEGTWLSVDVSPDGQTIVFDLLGHLHTIPIRGGKAKRITDGMAVDLQPRFSRNGNSIVFLSDRSGTYNVWLVDSDGSNPHPVTRSVHSVNVARDYVQPCWTPDGKIVVSRSPSPLGFDLIALEPSGDSVSGMKFFESGPPPASPGLMAGTFYTASSTFGKDRKQLYATQFMGIPGLVAHPQASSYQVVRIDPDTGKRTQITDEIGSAIQPLASPDGKYLVYATKYPSAGGPKTGLKLLNLGSGEATWLAATVETSLQGSFVHWPFGLLPNAAFTPDSQALVTSYGGKLWRIAVPSGQTKEVPFTADVVEQAGPLLRFPAKYDDEPTVRIVRDVRPSPDGKRLAFVALDRVWVMDLPVGQPKAISPEGSYAAYSPAWSPDGRFLAYLTWTDQGGHVYQVPTSEIGGYIHPIQITHNADYFDKLVYDPGGLKMVLVRADWRTMLYRTGQRRMELTFVSPFNGQFTPIFEFKSTVGGFGWPHFSRRDPNRIFFFMDRNLWAVKSDGSGRDAVIKTTGGVYPADNNDVLLSPAGDRALLAAQSSISVLQLPLGETSTVSLRPQIQAQGNVRLVTPAGGEFPWWSADGKSFTYSIGHSVFTSDLSHLAKRADIVIRVPRDKAKGAILLTNGRVLTMHGKEVLEAADILIRDNRIAAVGAHGKIQVPRDAHRLDVTGKTILPGYVLTHEHVEPPFNVHDNYVWQYLSALSYGITTFNDPQSRSSADRFTYADRVETGTMLGPRHVSTGTAIFGEPDSLEETRLLVQRYSRFYDSHVLKERDSRTRRVHQWVAMAAKEEKLTVMAHWYQDLTSHILDGYSGIEHLTYFPWYGDMIQLLAQSGTVYTPTHLIGSNGPQPLGYFSQRADLAHERRLWRFVPLEALDFLLHPEFTVSGLALSEDYVFPAEAAQAAKLVKAGGRVGVGTDGVFLGLGGHWEMWALAMGGVPAWDVLRSATLTGAEALGFDKEIGSIQPGKLADLQILDSNPLEDIHNTKSVHWVMKSGRLYEANTLNEVWPESRLLVVRNGGDLWWWRELPAGLHP